MPHISALDWTRHTHIGLDLDETLAATMLSMLEGAHRQGKLLQIQNLDDITSYDFTDLDPTLSREDEYALWEAYGKNTLHPESVAEVEGSRRGVENLISRAKKLSIITARSDDEDWKKPRTIHWISRHFPEISEIHFVNHFTEEARPKSSVCEDYGVTLLIDDSIGNALELAEKGMSTILLEKPWNRNLVSDNPLIFRAKDWEEIIDSLKIIDSLNKY